MNWKATARNLFMVIVGTLALSFIFMLIYAHVGDPKATISTYTGYSLFLGAITMLFLIVPFVMTLKSKELKGKGKRKFLVALVTLFGMFYLCLLFLNLIYILDSNINMHVAYTGFSIVLFDICMSFYWFNVDEWNRNNRSKTIVYWSKTIFYALLALASMVVLISYIYQIAAVDLPLLFKTQAPQQIREKEFWNSLITLFPITLTVLYIAHKFEKSEVPYHKGPFNVKRS